MGRAEQRNLAIFVAVVGALLAGGALLANYSGILQADEPEQAKVSCSGEGKVCAATATEAAGFPAVHASAETAHPEGCCSSEKAGGCGDKAAGCGDTPAGCSGEKPAGCCDEPPIGGCCDEPKVGGCCGAKDESTT